MPFVDLHSGDDYASIYYITNTPLGNVGGFDPKKPTIIMLHPTYMDSKWLDNQFGDPRLDKNYNLIAFDMRVSGDSTCRPNGKHDSWVEAADLAFCHMSLELPPCHVLACESISVNCALRFAILFPDMCLSLTLINVPAPTELGWVFTALDEVTQALCYAEDLESFEHAAMEAVRFTVGSDCDTDLQDDLIAYWEVNMAPTRRVRAVEQMNVIMNRVPLKPYMLKHITQPVLIIQGERNETCPVKFAERLVADLVNAKNGAVLYTVKGGTGALSIIPGTASIANQVFAKFVSRFKYDDVNMEPVSIPTEERMAEALAKLSELMADSSITSRNPMSSLSFSCLSADAVKGQTESLALYRKGQSTAFTPVGPDGVPIRRFSERKKEHWFQGERDGISYAGASFLPLKLGKHDLEHEKQLPLPVSDPISTDVQQGRLRRATISPSSIDKQVIKGSMAKVVGSNSNPASLQRLLNK
ncbi:alpha/beta-hydrolase [Dendrothele bispora CBS 962.96]|uniref:Alpha/beta-hydrolase n=1 Tax=Dendrothele bispora (strain CBS 962.96) TaxID=1314807 RepID=A0A4S8L5N9_DENBC|nr:alpha/beta-hydrolase [Dendrothele bispora CBS 962.96]